MTVLPDSLERARRSWLVLACRLVYRFAAGKDLVGEGRTTATFLRPGDARGDMPAWWFQHHPGHRRARFRALTVFTVAALVYIDLTTPTLFWWLVAAAGVAAVPTVGIALWTHVQGRKHHRRFGRSALLWLRDTYGHQVSIQVPRKHLDDPDHPAVLRFPPELALSETEKPRLARKAADKLGLTDFQAEWDQIGRPVLRISTAPLPPQRVNIATKTHVLDKAVDGKLYLGEGARKQEVFVDLDQESPHELVSAGTGGGKSVTFRGQCAQLLHDGGVLLIADVKRISHMWAKDLPNVHYARDAQDIHDAIIGFAAEVARRNRIADKHVTIDGNVDRAVIGPRLGLLLEEINATQAILNAYWKTIRTPDDPVKSPAVEALHAVLFMGRAVYAHVFTAGQQVTARSLGGGEARENFGCRIIARASQNTWKMLAPECAVRGKFPAGSRVAGRVHVVQAGEAQPCQVAWWSNEEARAYALSGTVVDYHEAVGGGTVLRVESQVTRDTTALVGLREAHGAGVGASLEALRRASTRPGFPAPVETFGDKNLYDLDELRRWESNRVRPREVASS